MEQQTIYNAANFKLACFNDNTVGELANSTASTARLNVFLCPSTPPPSFNFIDLAVTVPAPGNSYFASLGPSIEFAANQTGGPPNGVFQYDNTGRYIGIRDILDGTSNTIAFGEWKIGSGNKAVFTPATDIVFYGFGPFTRNQPQMQMPAGAGLFQQWITACTAALKTANRGSKTPAVGTAWSIGIVGFTMGSTLLPPNPKYTNCSTNAANTIEDPGMMNMSSFHAGGANILMCDGSVKFLKDSTNMTVVWSLGSRAQGEVIGADSY
jgi:prepilin-type processing-associated H-X9-DG protein